MTKVYEYRNIAINGDYECLPSVRAMTGEQLGEMAKKIFANGRIEKEEVVYKAENCFTVKCDGMPIRYIVKIDCLEVSEIIELIEITA